MKKRIFCLMLAVTMLCICLTGCGEEVVERGAGQLKYDTYAEFAVNGEADHRHPVKDGDLRYALYTEYVQVIECVSDAEEVVIPAYYDGLPVISIRAGAFDGRENLKRVVLGGNLLHIGDNAFANCTKLVSVVMSDSINEICVGAFTNCKSLTSIIIPPKVNLLPSGTFAGCSSLRKVIFESADRTETVELERGDTEVLRTIESGVFTDCEKLRIMWIPEDIAIVQDSILGGTTPKPLICGGTATASAYFATLQCLDYQLVSRDDFDVHARLFKDLDMVDRTEMGTSVTTRDSMTITLKDVKYYNKLGSAVANENQTIVAIRFSISHDAQIPIYFDGLNVKCTSQAPGKEGFSDSFNKLPIYIDSEILGVGYPVGMVYPSSPLEGVIVLRVSSRFESITIQFAGTDTPFVI